MLVENRKARFNYEILEKVEAGVELLGFEVKSLREKKGSLEGAYAIVRGGEAFLINMTITPFQPKNTPASYDPMRPRRLLLTKKEIEGLSQMEAHGLTIVPLSVYNKGRNIKMEIGIARGKKRFDKREDIKKREADRELRREEKER